MELGPDLVVACPHCQALARIFTAESVDPTGAITWSDGWQDLPMMPRPARVTQCGSCRRFYWTWQAPQLGYLPPPEIATPEQAGWATAPHVEPLDAAGAEAALAAGLGENSDLEMELRVLLWWRGNDAFRHAAAPVGYATEEAAISNMERLVEMMENGDEDLLLFRAEAQRELGHFDDALHTLDGVCCSDWWPAKSRLLGFIAARSRKLEPLFSHELAATAGELAT